MKRRGVTGRPMQAVEPVPDTTISDPFASYDDIQDLAERRWAQYSKGDVFGCWRLLEDRKPGRHEVAVECTECGERRQATRQFLCIARDRNFKRCVTCARRRSKKTAPKAYQPGDTIGRLTIICQIDQKRYRLRCRCGKSVTRAATTLNKTVFRKSEMSCGCARRSNKNCAISNDQVMEMLRKLRRRP